MTRILVDTNTLVDFLAMREPFYQDAHRLLVYARAGEYELWMSSSQVTDLLYILSNGGRSSETDAARAAVRGLRRIVHVCAPGEAQVDAALNSTWRDFEDAFLFEAARMIDADVIVTRDTRGFAQSPIPHLDVPAFFDWIEEGTGTPHPL